MVLALVRVAVASRRSILAVGRVMRSDSGAKRSGDSARRHPVQYGCSVVADTRTGVDFFFNPALY